MIRLCFDRLFLNFQIRASPTLRQPNYSLLNIIIIIINQFNLRKEKHYGSTVCN